MSSPNSNALRATLSPQSLKRTMDELLAGDTPAAAPPAQPTFTTLGALTASPRGELQVTEEQDEAATPSSHESISVLGDFVGGVRATPPRPLFTPTPPGSGGEVPDKFAPPEEVVWQSPAPREPDPALSPYVDKSTSDSNASREITASELQASAVC